MPVIKALDPEDVLRGAAQRPVCLLVGDDDSLRSRSLLLMKDAAAPMERPGSTVREFAATPEARDVFDELRTIPFMGLAGRRAVVIDDADAFLANNWEGLARYLRSPNPDATLLMGLSRLDPKRPPGRAASGETAAERRKRWTGLLKAIGSDGTIVECKRPSWRDAKAWLNARAGELGKKLTPRAADMLVESIGPNLLALGTELEKLATYAGSDVTITERDGAELVAEARERSVFELGDAVSRGDLAAALKLCRELLLRGERREGIISVLALQLRRSWQLKRLQADGATQAEMARAVGVPPSILRKSLSALPQLTERRLAAQIDALSDADVESKTSSLRAQEEGVWLEGLLARLCAA
jgi:DNA polymerase-3 subunit delta